MEKDFIIWGLSAALFIIGLAAFLLNEYENQKKLNKKDEKDLIDSKRR